MILETTEKIKTELLLADPRLEILIEKYGDIKISLASNYFESLASSIVGQQLSNKAANVIWNRFVALLGGAVGSTPSAIKAPSNYKQSEEYQISPQAVIAANADEMRSVGLSYGKISYLKNLATAVENGGLSFDNYHTMENEKIISELTAIKGIGRWTAEMFLIFSLGRQDVFSQGDGGLFNAIKTLYSIANPTKSEIQVITKRWSPYRTFASLYLWKSLDNE